MARPTKLTPKLADRVLEALRAGVTIEAACSAGPIAPSTFYDWVRRGRTTTRGKFHDFAEAVDMAQLDAERTLVEAWRAHVVDDWRAAAELLARRFPERWRRPSAVELSGPNGGPVAMEITNEERARNLAESLRDHLERRRPDDDPDDDPDGEPSEAA